MKGRIESHKELCKELMDLYELKNLKYGNSFEATFEDYGPISLLIRLEDKISRARNLLKNSSIDPGDESIRDTLLDLANYTIMGLIELDRAKEDDN